MVTPTIRLRGRVYVLVASHDGWAWTQSLGRLIGWYGIFHTERDAIRWARRKGAVVLSDRA